MRAQGFAAAAFVVFWSGTALAGPTAAAGTEAFCQGYAETYEGVWVDASGVDTLLFRFAMNSDGTVCYAWLNAVAQWNISEPGSNSGPNGVVNGSLRIWGETPRSGARGVSIDVETGEARFAGGGAVTRGRLLNR